VGYAKVDTLWDDSQVNDRIQEGWEVIGYEPSGDTYDEDNVGYRMGLPWRVVAIQLKRVIQELDRCGLISVFKTMKQLDPNENELVADEYMQIILDHVGHEKGPRNLEAIKAAIGHLETHGEREYLLP